MYFISGTINLFDKLVYSFYNFRECYLRFCSHLFSLSNMHESVHLSNNAIQCKYKNEKKRDKLLPEENMWDSLTFQAYLR